VGTKFSRHSGCPGWFFSLVFSFK